MKQNRVPPVKKNDELTLEIAALTGEGQGVARTEGYAVFVPGALPHERVRAHVIKVTPGYAVAKPRETLAAAPERVRPACPAYPSCGGCTLQHLDYAAQLDFKRQLVVDALERLGGFAAPPRRPRARHGRSVALPQQGQLPLRQRGRTPGVRLLCAAQPPARAGRGLPDPGRARGGYRPARAGMGRVLWRRAL